MNLLVAQSQSSGLMKTLMVLFLGLLTAFFIGLVSSTSNIFFVGIIGGVLLASLAAIFPRLLLWVSIVGGIVVTGSIRLYYPPLQFISWVVAGASSLLLIYVAGVLFKMPSDTTRRIHIPGVILIALLFVLLVVFTTFFNKSALGTTISGLKGYFQIWPLLFVLSIVRWDEQTMQSFPRAIFWIALLQIPFVLHQYLVLVPQRTGLGFGVVPVDIVSGTFGGDKNAGGSNATLALFMVMTWAGILASWKFKMLSTWKMLASSALLLFPLFLNESKVAVFYLAMVFFFLYREDLARRPHVFVVGVISTALLVFGLLTSYVAIHAHENNSTMSAYVQETIDQNFGDLRSRWSTYLNRYSVYGFWADHHGLHDPVHTLVGHGLAQSKEAAGAIAINSLATSRYPGMGIGLSGLSSMLWDVGILGTGAILAMFWWGWRKAGMLARHFKEDVRMMSLFRAIQAVIPIFVLSLAHKNFFVFDLPYQTLLLGTLGYIAYWKRHIDENLNLREGAAESPDDPQP